MYRLAGPIEATAKPSIPNRKMRICSTFVSGETRNRTEDTTIFSRVLYQLSYLALGRDPSGLPWASARLETSQQLERPVLGQRLVEISALG
jgi:hypothetical protein